jgi:hypothetical protein
MKKVKAEFVNEVYESVDGTFEGRVTGKAGSWAIELRSPKTKGWIVDSRHATACDACEVLTVILTEGTHI